MFFYKVLYSQLTDFLHKKAIRSSSVRISQALLSKTDALVYASRAVEENDQEFLQWMNSECDGQF